MRGGFMKATLERAFGYQDAPMALPVADVDAALPFYERVLGFRVAARADQPHRSAVLERDAVRIGLVQSGGDPSQDGCAFHVTQVDALFAEFKANGLPKEEPDFSVEDHGGASFKVFYVVAPDGLCYWFGERQASPI
jgi:lactoylglutathione lyase